MYIEQRRLTDELRMHGDLLFVDTIDTYRTLSQKMWAGMSWAARERQAEWVVKFDDDVVVSLSTLLHELRRYEPHRQILGTTMNVSPVYRKGKWREDRYRPHENPAIYPPYPVGVGYAISMDLAKLISSIPMKQYSYSSEDVSLGIMAEQLGGVKLTQRWWWALMWSRPTVWLPSEANYFLNFVTGEIPTFGQISGTDAGSGLSEELQLFMWELHRCYLHENHLLASESGCIAAVDEMRRLRDLWQNCQRVGGRVTAECRQPLTLNATFVNTLQTSLAPYKAVVTMHQSGNEARQQTSIMKKRVS